MSTLIPQPGALETYLVDQLVPKDRQKASRVAIRRLRAEVEETAVSQFKIERAKAAAVSAMLAEDQIRTLAGSLANGDPARRMMADDYVRAIHAVGVNQILKAG